MKRVALASALAGALLLSGCRGDLPSPRNRRDGIQHPVQRGENLFRIGKAYGIDFRDLARVNRLSDPARIRVGQRIFIPGASRVLPVEMITPIRADSKPSPPRPAGPARFRWPVRGAKLTSRFGPRGDSIHDGIDLFAPVGTPVVAAGAGRVIYSDRLRGYGNVIIVDHDGGWLTVYAHNSKNLVAQGVRVRKGDKIGAVGQTGRATGPHLHFEVRKNNVARDPIPYLPPR